MPESTTTKYESTSSGCKREDCSVCALIYEMCGILNGRLAVAFLSVDVRAERYEEVDCSGLSCLCSGVNRRLSAIAWPVDVGEIVEDIHHRCVVV